jgi:hypothetical protein
LDAKVVYPLKYVLEKRDIAFDEDYIIIKLMPILNILHPLK